MSGREAACLRSFVHELGQTERYVLLLFYADDLTPTEIGVVLQLPKRRVQAILMLSMSLIPSAADLVDIMLDKYCLTNEFS